jgi:hypothetical protein
MGFAAIEQVLRAVSALVAAFAAGHAHSDVKVVGESHFEFAEAVPLFDARVWITPILATLVDATRLEATAVFEKALAILVGHGLLLWWE